MKKMLSSLLIIILFSCDQSYESVNPIPSNRQKIWQEMEYYAVKRLVAVILKDSDTQKF